MTSGITSIAISVHTDRHLTKRIFWTLELFSFSTISAFVSRKGECEWSS
nr:MAG TPA: hypothetical protein [Caudoviricetes sp.]